MRIEDLRLESSGDSTRAAATVVWEDREREPLDIWFEADGAIGRDLSADPHAFLVSCMPVALWHGEARLAVDGAVCPELRSGLDAAMKLLCDWYAMREAPLRVECREGRAAPQSDLRRHAGAVLSGGIDSLATLRANRLDYPRDHPLSIRDCMFLYGFDMGVEREERHSYDRAYAALSAVAVDADITLIPVRTNVRRLDPDLAFWMYAFHGAAISAVAHVFSSRLAIFFIGSYDVAGLFMPYGSHPLLDPCYSGAGLRIRSDGYACTRLEKVAIVAGWDVGLRNLRVCTVNAHGLLNCGDCEKCIRTMTELLVLGKLGDATSFPVRDVTPELLSSVVIDSEDLDVLYAPLADPLRSLGRRDLADIIDAKSKRFHRQLNFIHERDVKGLVKRLDRRVLGGRLLALRNAFKDPAVVARQEAERRLWGAGEAGPRARGAGRIGKAESLPPRGEASATREPVAVQATAARRVPVAAVSGDTSVSAERGEWVRVGVPVVRTAHGETVVEFAVDGLGAGSLTFHVPEQFGTFASRQSDAAVVALLIPSMIAGKDLRAEGTVSPKLLFNLNTYLIPLLRQVNPVLRPVRVSAPSSTSVEPPATKVTIAGLSNGVDSLTTVLDYLLDPQVPPALRIAYFVFNDVGAHGQGFGETIQRLFDERYAACLRVAALLGREVIPVRSNMSAFYSRPFAETHTLRNAAVGLLLQGGATTFLYSSAHAYRDAGVNPPSPLASVDLSVADPIVLPLLSTETLDCVSAGAAYTRVEKTAKIAALPLAQEHLNVCVSDADNCSVCFKCARTLLTLELMGHLVSFSKVFDLAKYSRIREGYVAHVLARRREGLLREIADLMREVGYAPTLRERTRGAVAAVLDRTLTNMGERRPVRLLALYERVTHQQWHP